MAHRIVVRPPALALLRVALLAMLLGPGLLRAQEQAYWDWARLDFPADEYEARRAKLLDELGQLGDGVLLIPGAQGTSHGPSFRQLDDMHYWTGLELPSSMLVVDPSDRTVTLYAPARDPRFENPGRRNDFPGRPLADDAELSRRTGLEIRDAADLDRVIASIASSRAVYVDLGAPTATTAEVRLDWTPDLTPEQLLILKLRADHPAADVRNGFRAVARVRAVKSPAELAVIRRLAALTEEAIRSAAGRVRPGVDERTLEGWFELGCKEAGAQRVPFHPIIKSGPNSLWAWRILASHYDRRNRTVRDGELVIFDVGCELDHYVSDVGRTVPVSGTFTPEQARALDAQRRVADAIIEAIRPGVTLAEVTEAGVAAMTPEMRRYMQTGSFYSHHLGLSTGDPVLTDEPLRAGMVFTVEPWYYNHDSGISVFVEDMVLVTEDGAEILTANLPRTVDGLERLVGRR
jgi:Xaa-Pro aminopeptidase